jgi:hypothetical protein
MMFSQFKREIGGPRIGFTSRSRSDIQFGKVQKLVHKLVLIPVLNQSE